MVRRDFACRNIHRYGGAARADIDAGDRATGRGDGIGQEGEFLTLGVGGADHIDALHPRSRCLFQLSGVRYRLQLLAWHCTIAIS